MTAVDTVAAPASKHALQAFSEGIRHELAPFNVQVCTVNPSFHGTGMVSGATEQFRALWAKVPAALKQQYGSEFAANRERVLNATYSCSGRPSRVVRRMVDLLMRDGSLPAREVVGSDPAARTSSLPHTAPVAAPCGGIRAPPSPRGDVPRGLLLTHARVLRPSPRSDRVPARVLDGPFPRAADAEAKPPGARLGGRQ